jgi:DNA-binding CsgD family transcriptional regulator
MANGKNDNTSQLTFDDFETQFNYADDAYKDPEVLRELIERQELTLAETANKLEVSSSTILNYLKKFGIGGRGVNIDVPPELDEPSKDEGFMRRVYLEEQNTTQDIAIALDIAQSTVRKRLQEHGIPLRSIREAQWISSPGHRHWVNIVIDKDGHVNWRIPVNNKARRVAVHRLLAVAEYGFEPVKGKRVHHKNGIPWDNRHDNIEILTRKEHKKAHQKLTWLDKLRIAELYENGNISYRKLEDQFPVSSATILKAHHEVVSDSETDGKNPKSADN